MLAAAALQRSWSRRLRRRRLRAAGGGGASLQFLLLLSPQPRSPRSAARADVFSNPRALQ